MPYNCCVPRCSSKQRKSCGLMFHKFLLSSIMKKKWLTAIKSGKQPTKYTKICSKHFTDECYTITSMGKLKNNKNIYSILQENGRSLKKLLSQHNVCLFSLQLVPIKETIVGMIGTTVESNCKYLKNVSQRKQIVTRHLQKLHAKKLMKKESRLSPQVKKYTFKRLFL